MKANELIEHLQKLVEQHGNFVISKKLTGARAYYYPAKVKIVTEPGRLLPHPHVRAVFIESTSDEGMEPVFHVVTDKDYPKRKELVKQRELVKQQEQKKMGRPKRVKDAVL